ncbi:MAG: hypothetical protein ACTSVA_00910 [Candidatus Njordarchaeales archaeon]
MSKDKMICPFCHEEITPTYITTEIENVEGIMEEGKERIDIYCPKCHKKIASWVVYRVRN